MKKTGLLLIEQERLRQITHEGFSLEHDLQTSAPGQLAMAAACYAAPESIYVFHANAAGGSEFVGAWPPGWDPAMDKRKKHDRIKQLAIAGALAAAEIDYLLAIEADWAAVKGTSSSPQLARESVS